MLEALHFEQAWRPGIFYITAPYNSFLKREPCVWWFAFMYVCAPRACNVCRGQKRALILFGTGFEPPCGFLDLNPCSMEEQPELLNAEPSP